MFGMRARRPEWGAWVHTNSCSQPRLPRRAGSTCLEQPIFNIRFPATVECYTAVANRMSLQDADRDFISLTPCGYMLGFQIICCTGFLFAPTL